VIKVLQEIKEYKDCPVPMAISDSQVHKESKE
jgi:hypothetical protein